MEKNKNDNAVSSVLGVMLMLALTVAIILPAFFVGATTLSDYAISQSEILLNRFFLKVNTMIDDIDTNKNNNSNNNDDNPKSNTGSYKPPKFDSINETLSITTGNETITISLKILNDMSLNMTGEIVYRIPPPEP